MSPIRDLAFVEGPAEGSFFGIEYDSLVGSATNIGMRGEIIMGDLLKKIVQLVGRDISFEVDPLPGRPTNGEVECLYCVNSRILEYIDCLP